MIIGRDYKKAFNSAYELINSGLLSDNKYLREQAIYVQPGEDNVIYHGRSEYRYVEEDSRYGDVGEAMFTEDGSTWFDGIRKGDGASENAQWIAFLSSLAREYHKKYSLMEYYQNARNDSQLRAEERAAKELINKLVKLLMPHLGEVNEWGDLQNNDVDLYGVSLRIEISGGSIPEPVPVLCKVYFRRDNKGAMQPLEGSVAENIEKSIQGVELGSQGNHKIQINSRVIDDTLRSLGKLVEGEYAQKGKSLIKCVCCSDEDKKAIVDIRKRAANGAAKFECRSVKVLGVSHVMWRDQTIDAYIDQQPVFRVTLGINQNVSMRCLNCQEDAALITENVISYNVQDDFGNIERRRVILDKNAANFGLSAQEIADIKNNLFADHLVEVKCPENPRKNDCHRLRCRNQLETFQLANGEKIRKCTDCRYPEIIYKNTKGEKMYTPSLMIASNVGDLMNKDDLVKCNWCGRYFTQDKDGIPEGKKNCAFCSAAAAKKGADEARARFKRYAGMFPTWSRLGGIISDKLCYEDDEILLFIIGDNKYKVDKVSIGDFGYVNAPQKIK
ncbi:MAG: hypothetical protein J6S04_06355 [Clostridia bacterium]|nr:hypothetical protein [Clostridia bacterium]